MILRNLVRVGAVATAAGLCMTAPVAAADFYKGKTVRMFIGSGAGGGFDTYGRTVGQFLGKHIPGKPKRTRQGAGQHSRPRHNKKRYRGQGR